MRTAAQLAGSSAEDLVATSLQELGWIVVGRNVRVGRAEIDVLAIDPGPPRTVVVVEVRWRRRRDYGLPEETIDRAKLARLRAAAAVLRRDGPRDGVRFPRLPLRLDIVAVEPGGTVRHHRAVG